MTLQITDIMTPCPNTIESHKCVADAKQLMQIGGIRHLPVVEDGDLVGILSEREVQLAEIVEKAMGGMPRVGDICQKDPHVVFDDTPLAEIASEVAERKIDCALIVDKDAGLIGIFTTVDACRCIQVLLES